MSERVSVPIALITVEAVELSLTTILTILWSTFGALTVLVAVLYWRAHRGAPSSGGASASAGGAASRGAPAQRQPSSREVVAPAEEFTPGDAEALEQAHRLWLNGLAGPGSWEDLSDTGRHHLPAELLDLSTYQLGPDRVARAKVPEQN
ncbi:hypothetical protein COUCH_05675 [Couchioplanes caeruleus]|uniref:hypothetical protein n=1 Tax=Couchioplanes caeruleus TaxID=56438 RepID=UPI0020BF6DB9|nr:hypothetical protein [Couchioplanes caeruleus]UQU65804.1 hypothetical protein COUCH_05675 [Couchioplanes caeruleus]